jgi:hypothetical protein
LFEGSLKREDIIFCAKIGGLNKSDLVVKCNNISHTISIKKGNENSIHQEPLEEFIKFLKEEYDIDQSIADDLRFFIWGDGTLNSTGKKRLKASELKKQYPERISGPKRFFKKHKKDLIKRFLINGPKSQSSPEFIYYGTVDKGKWGKSEDILKFLSEECKESKIAAIPIGGLTMQAWNRNTAKQSKKNRRGSIQVKWNSIDKHLKLIGGPK